MNSGLRRKLEHLKEYLKTFDRVGVACSGGVDSTVLAYACKEVLGHDRIVVVFGDSPLLTAELRDSIESFLNTELGADLRFKRIFVDPFSKPEFCRNSQTRCYICKSHIYQRFLEHLAEEDINILFDGTNCDDLGEDRPGLRALEELGIVKPLVEAGLYKSDVRELAAFWGLGNANLPSNSCLATRLAPGTEISGEKLRRIEAFESFLHQRGYQGCRVRTRDGGVVVEILSEDLSRIVKAAERSRIVAYFRDNGYPHVWLDLVGRNC